MERIIIREKDLTSNVEQLSSYDVVYVPGFSVGYNDENLFRNPVLITSKYKFRNTFGNTCPSFPSDQPWPEATSTTEGFPSYAIPNYSDLVVDSSGINLTSFDSIGRVGEEDSEFTTYYSPLTLESDFEPDRNLNYFIAERTVNSTGNYTVSYSTLPKTNSQGEVYVDEETGLELSYFEIYGENGAYWKDPETGLAVKEGCVAVTGEDVNPLNLHWYENVGSSDSPVYRPTGDTQISFVVPGDEGGDPFIKTYFLATKSTPPMFYAEDKDPGYRYALYLLSLGIPVYYECMNSGNHWKEVELLHSDFDAALLTYGSYEEGDTDEEGQSARAIRPYKLGWYYYDAQSSSYKKASNEKEAYHTAGEVVGKTWYIGADISLDSMYTGLKKRFMADPDTPDYSFDSMGDYSIKYMTTGGYPVFEYGVSSTSNDDEAVPSGLAYSMMFLCKERGDSIALIDHTDNPDRTIYSEDELSVSNKAKQFFMNFEDTVASHGAMFTPWYHCTHEVIAGDSTIRAENSDVMPASLAYLSSLAVQLRNYNPWLAVSGVTRGKIPYFGSLHTNYNLTNNVADSYQYVPSGDTPDVALVSINPITYIRQYGYCIWGNRTLRNNKLGTKATSFLNIRNVVSDIKKLLYDTSQQLLFEQNTEVLWLNFKTKVTPLLDTMVSSYILSDYKLTKYNVDPVSGEPVPAYMVLASLKIMPINSVEVFDLTVQLENNEIIVEEEE